jgi:hypothetical protein
MIPLQYTGSDDGFCKVMYKSPKGNMYCMLEEGKGQFQLYTMSHDYEEPIGPIESKHFEIPATPGYNETERSLNEFLERKVV